MPVGPYPDFDACLADNQDKDDPGAFCAFLEDRTGGGMTKTILGLEIFSTGTHTDSMGTTETFSGDDIDTMVEQFNSGQPWRPAVKLGHTSDEFNEMVAAALGVPVETLSGEGGAGVIALGEIVRLKRKQNKLVADLEVPDQVADWIDRGFLRDVSSEMILDDDDNWVISGLALLGAEAPAVDDLKGLASAAVHRSKENPKELTPAHAFSTLVPAIVFNKGTGIPITEDDTPGMKRLADAILKRLKRATGSEDNDVKTVKFTTDELVAMKLAEHLDDDDDEPDKDSVKDAVQKLQDDSAKLGALKEGLVQLAELVRTMQGDDEDEEDELDEGAEPEVIAAAAKKTLITFQAKVKAASGDMAAALKIALKPLQDEIREFKSAARTSKFESRVKALLIPGKPKDLLKQLNGLDDEVAEAILATWESSSDILKSQGITERIGRATADKDLDDDEGDETFAAAVEQYKKDFAVTTAEAEQRVRLQMFTDRDKEPEETIKA